MPGPLSETLKRIRSPSRSTLTPTTGTTPAVSQASRELSTSSFRQTLANSSCDTPTSAESWRASKYSAAPEVSKVVLCSWVISSFRDSTNAGVAPATAVGGFSLLAVLVCVADEHPAQVADTRVIMILGDHVEVVGNCLEGIAGQRYSVLVHSDSSFPVDQSPGARERSPGSITES